MPKCQPNVSTVQSCRITSAANQNKIAAGMSDIIREQKNWTGKDRMECDKK